MSLKNLAVALGVGVLGFRTPHPLPFGCPEGMFELPGVAISAAGFPTVTSRRATHNPKVGGSNPPPATNLSIENIALKQGSINGAFFFLPKRPSSVCVRVTGAIIAPCRFRRSRFFLWPKIRDVFVDNIGSVNRERVKAAMQLQRWSGLSPASSPILSSRRLRLNVALRFADGRLLARQ